MHWFNAPNLSDEAFTRLSQYSSEAGLSGLVDHSITEVLPKRTLARIADAVGAWKIQPQKRKGPQKVWVAIVTEALEDPWNLGWIIIEERGLPALATSLEVNLTEPPWV